MILIRTRVYYRKETALAINFITELTILDGTEKG